MIKIKKNMDKFITLFKIINNLTTETNIIFKKDGIHIKAIHPSNICFAAIIINKSMFEEYEIENEITYLIDIEKFVNIMNIVADKEMKIEITEKGLIIKQGRKKFKLSYFDGINDDKPKPNIKTISKWKINSNDFFKNINDLIIFNEIGTLEAKEELTIESKSNLVDGKIIIDADKIESEDSIAYYDIGIMNKINNIKQIFPEIRIGFSNDEPIIMRGTTDDINFEFMLASRVKE